MYYMFKDIVDTLTAALPLGLLAGVLIFVLKRYAFKINKPKLYAVCEIAFWAYVYILLYRTVIGREPIYDPLSEVWQGWTIFRRRWTGLDYQVIGTGDGLTKVQIRLHTGRTHQIRVQFATRGMPLVGERKYSTLEDPCEIALWSYRLGFAHPATGEHMEFCKEPPEDFPWTAFTGQTPGKGPI